MKTIFLLAVFLFVFSSIAFAVGPGIPHQFWGTVTINGNLASDGTQITSTVNGVSADSTTASGGAYNLIIRDPNNVNTGKTVVLYVNGVQAASDVFANGKSTQLNLAITVNTPPPNNPPSGGGGGGSGISSTATDTHAQQNVTPSITTTASTTTSSGVCKERWLCTDWSVCKGGTAARQCEDVNKCGTNNDEPMISQPCSIEETTAANNPGALGGIGNMISGLYLSAASAGSTGYAVGLLVLVGLGAYFLKGKAAK